MSRAHDFLTAVLAQPHADLPKPVYGLLRAVADAWVQAEETGCGEAEAWRWSPVCDAAERLLAGEAA